MKSTAPGGDLPPGLVVNADDLGIHPSINAGILSAYRQGILTSCTMLMTTPFLEETVRDFVRPAALPIGIHLSLTLGTAAAPLRDVPNLTDAAGNLKLSAARLVVSNLWRHKSLLGQIRCELSAQLARARDCGLHATHADSHQHVHMNPLIFAIVEDLLPRFGIYRFRYCREPFPSFALGADLPALLKRFNPAKWALLRWRSLQMQPKLATTDQFFGIIYSGAMTRKALHSAIARMAPGRSLEICIHPGFRAPAGDAVYPRPGYNQFISSPARQLEHDLLLDRELGDLIRSRGLVLRAFDGRGK
jgi:chitin disaccharide deacetylase